MECSDGQLCQIGGALATVGVRWTLLIMRELFLGTRRFDDIVAQTGMSSHLLSTRLKRMQQDGLIERRRYNESPPRYEYWATGKGKELDAILLALRAWGLRWGTSALGAEPAMRMVEKASRDTMDAGWTAPRGSPFTFDQADVTLHEAYVSERSKKSHDFQLAKRRGALALKKKAGTPPA